MSRYIYEHRQVGSSRKQKWCEVCGKDINKGEPSITVTVFCDEFFAVDVCSEECRKKHEEDFDKDEDEE